MAANSVQYIFDLIDEFTPVLRKIQREQKKYTKTIKKTTTQMQKMRASFKKFGRQVRQTGKNLSVRITAPLIALGTISTIAFARMEKGLINVNNLLSREELKIFGKDLEMLQENALKAGFSIEDANKGLFDMISGLGASESSFKAFLAAQKLAIGGATSLERATDGITSILNTYGKTTVSATEAANTFFSAQVKGKTTVEELATNVGQVAPIAKAAGIGFKELLAGISALTTGGLTTDIAVTSLKGALTALVKVTPQTRKALKAMNIVFGAANIKSKGLSKTLQSVADAQKKFGLDAITLAIPNIRALTAVTALSADKIALLDKIVQKINSDLKTGDGLMRAFTDQNKSMAQQFAQAKGEMTVAMKKFVEQFAPEIKKAAKFIGGITNKMASLSPETKKMIVILLALAAVIPPLLIVAGTLALAIGVIASPITLVVFAIGSLIAALVLLKKRYAKIFDFIKNRPMFKAIGKLKDIFSGNVKTTNTNTFSGAMDININAPKGTVNQIKTKKAGKNFKLGTNMQES